MRAPLRRSRRPKSNSSALVGSPPEAVAAFLAKFPPTVATTAEAVRTVIRAAIPTAVERVLPGWRSLGYRDPQAGQLCALFPYEGTVRLYLEHGAALEARGLDPAGLLFAGPTMRRGRYVELRPERRLSAATRRALHELLVAAVTHASL